MPAKTKRNSEHFASKRQKTKHIIDDTPASFSESEDERWANGAIKDGNTKDENDANENGDVGDTVKFHRPTEVESALPAIKAEKAEIEEYESKRAQGDGELSSELRDRIGARTWERGRSSIYVDAFNLALTTVLEEEGHLWNDAEKRIFAEWDKLNYDAQYLYVKLFLRKKSKWHRISALGYHSDIADMDEAVATLLTSRELPAPDGKADSSIKAQEREDERRIEANRGESFTFADLSNDHITTLEEASSLLSLDELKSIGREAKIQGKNKAELLASLKDMSRHQTGLGYAGLKRSNTLPENGSSETKREDENKPVAKKSATLHRQVTDGYFNEQDRASLSRDNTDGSHSPRTPPTFDDSNRDQHFVDKILDSVGPLIRINLETLTLFERLHLVYFRSTEWTEKSLTTIILAQCGKRNFPEFIVSRSANIFPSRQALLEFEASIRLQASVDDYLEFGRLTQEKMDAVMKIFEDVYPRWNKILAEEQQKEDTVYETGEGAYLRRFSPGWVYTRIVHKVTSVLARLQQHKREHEILTELLDQRLFHPSRRGAWYQRKALLEEHYMAELDPAFNAQEPFFQEKLRKKWKHISLATCEEGLQDSQTHVIYHYDLQKRIRKLEKSLKIAKRLKHDFGHVSLAQPMERSIKGTMVYREKEPGKEDRRGEQTIWVDEEDGISKCSVEAMCLTWYRGQGWKGYHAEGGIIRTLFAYLFYDILFLYIPNVFQTPYQTCPLDLHTDAFFPSRASEIRARTAEISNGGAKDIIKAVYEAHSEKQTCIIGLNWSFAIEDLLEIAECFDSPALAQVCLVMAQEYAQRGGGIPDLFLWRTDTKEVMFAEVKSENDRLSDTQRQWIHVLTGAGVTVELCHAEAKEVTTNYELDKIKARKEKERLRRGS